MIYIWYQTKYDGVLHMACICYSGKPGRSGSDKKQNQLTTLSVQRTPAMSLEPIVSVKSWTTLICSFDNVKFLWSLTQHGAHVHLQRNGAASNMIEASGPRHEGAYQYLCATRSHLLG